jgi:hypothetical protein
VRNQNDIEFAQELTQEWEINTDEANVKMDIAYLQELVRQAVINADKANVMMVRMQRVRIVKIKLPANVRKALNAAVKSGELCHKRKDGLRPEVYYHPSFEHLAIKELDQHEKNAIDAISSVMASPKNLP